MISLSPAALQLRRPPSGGRGFPLARCRHFALIQMLVQLIGFAAGICRWRLDQTNMRFTIANTMVV